ncbi:hypothetical protein SAMN05216593_103260 [Pseudomonas asturiensis]|uniref:Uncharacterized protein n=1 Tax=Pseudomonas asturiensis TaxID=1190415 RepID=A0A1M7LSJ6_9PSED|nr:hypothetical protein SAMN05216593_103260 [Pseudomonas asturiensis]
MTVGFVCKAKLTQQMASSLDGLCPWDLLHTEKPLGPILRGGHMPYPDLVDLSARGALKMVAR